MNIPLLVLSSLIPLCTSLTVMTMNTWLGGFQVKDGFKKIARNIKSVNPDVVALQELVLGNRVPELLALLGPEWTGHYDKTPIYPDVGVFTRHTIVSTSRSQKGIGAKIRLKGTNQEIVVWSMHLSWITYGPYLAMTTPKNGLGIIIGQENDRINDIKDLLASTGFKEQLAESNTVPVILAGDFNCPSHQDWVQSTKASHSDWAIEWPVTKILTDAGFTDSYRNVHPDPAKSPGNTWSTVTQSLFGNSFDPRKEPQDRIDFIFYRGPLSPISSEIYAGNKKLDTYLNHRNNDYPSDHYAVITEFEM